MNRGTIMEAIEKIAEKFELTWRGADDKQEVGFFESKAGTRTPPICTIDLAYTEEIRREFAELISALVREPS